jgi:hypothetical protein
MADTAAIKSGRERARTQDKMHLHDLIDVGLVNATWLPRLPPPLGDRLQELLDNPNG